MMLNQVSCKLVYPAYWKMRQMRVSEIMGDYYSSQWFSRDELHERQWKRLKKLLSHAYKNVPYYSRQMRDLGCHPQDIRSFSDFSRLPVLTKSDIIGNQDDLIARNFQKSKLIEDSTGGSTGQKICFYEDRNELSHRFASTIRSDSWAGLNLGERYAQVWGSSLDLGKANSMRRWVDRILLRRLFISSFSLSDENLAKSLDQIKKFRPKVLIGYPTPLHRFARYIKDSCIGPLGIQAIISSAETLHDFQKDEIERYLGGAIFNRYGCREFGPIAVECEKHQGLHILTDRFVVELINTGNDGDAPREIVITDLHKFGMPFIRYRIGDLAIDSDGTCTCGRGFPLLKSIEGRTFDIVIGTNGNFVSGTFWTLLFRSIRGINMFQVHQRVKSALEISLKVEDEFDPENLNLLQKIIQEKCGKDMKIGFQLVPEIHSGKSGKHRFVTSNVSRDYFAK